MMGGVEERGDIMEDADVDIDMTAWGEERIYKTCVSKSSRIGPQTATLSHTS